MRDPGPVHHVLGLDPPGIRTRSVACRSRIRSGQHSHAVGRLAMANQDPGLSADEAYAADLLDLRSFVVQLKELLEAIVEDGRHIPPSHRVEVREAWAHAKSDLEELVAALAQDASDLDHRQTLERHGLTGQPLRMKLRAWRSRFFQFGRRMNRRWLRSVLRWGDSILGSLVDALTVGAAGKEFKEAIENFIADAVEGGPNSKS
jgi:hypothetical protein